MGNYKSISEKSIDPDPFVQFENWYKEQLASGIRIPNTVSLGTASSDGTVSVRTILLKSYDKTGFAFFTNYLSKKASQLLSNPRAALLFYWPQSGRQVRIEGLVSKLSHEKSELYFKTRPRESQVSSWASKQSSVIPDRKYLEEQYEYNLNRFNNKPVPKPTYWGGYVLVPNWFEFWQEGDFRLHDRLTYSKDIDFWRIERLAP